MWEGELSNGNSSLDLTIYTLWLFYTALSTEVWVIVKDRPRLIIL
jgi:hypothetical protein